MAVDNPPLLAFPPVDGSDTQVNRNDPVNSGHPSSQVFEVDAASKLWRHAINERFSDSLADISPTPDSNYFCDGLAEEIITGLARVPDLRVIGRGSTSLFRDRTLALYDIADRLNANLVLDGSFRQLDCRIRVTAKRCVRPAPLDCGRLRPDLFLYAARYRD